MRGWHAALACHAAASGGRPVAGGSWPDGQPSLPSTQPVTHPACVDRLGGHHVQAHARAGHRATLAAMYLAGMTAVAQAQAADQQATRRPPIEGQVGESWRHRQAASQDQSAADATLQRVQARERFIPNATPAQTPAPAPPSRAGSPSGSSPGWVCWLPSWRWRAGWPSWLPSGPAAGLGSGTPDHGPAARWGCRAHPAAHHPPTGPDPGHRAMSCLGTLSQPTIDLSEQEEQWAASAHPSSPPSPRSSKCRTKGGG
jgi:hypothetical protein